MVHCNLENTLLRDKTKVAIHSMTCVHSSESPILLFSRTHICHHLATFFLAVDVKTVAYIVTSELGAVQRPVEGTAAGCAEVRGWGSGSAPRGVGHEGALSVEN